MFKYLSSKKRSHYRPVVLLSQYLISYQICIKNKAKLKYNTNII